MLQSVAFPSEIIRSIQQHRVTGVAAVSHMWLKIVDYLEQSGDSLPSLRYITSSGGKLPQYVLDKLPVLFEGVEIYLMYGQTEAFRSTYLPPEFYDSKRGSIGMAIPNVEVFVIDSKNGICGRGEEGELVHRGSLICQGYWNAQVETAKKIKNCEYLKPFFGEEKVLFTGDIVRIDDEGYLWFVGRNDAMIKSRGYRISPTEIEEAAYESALVESVVAFGVCDKDSGEEIYLAVKLFEHCDENIAELNTFLNKHLPSYMVPQIIYFLESDVPLGSSGKIDRVGLKKACLAGDSSFVTTKKGRRC